MIFHPARPMRSRSVQCPGHSKVMDDDRPYLQGGATIVKPTDYRYIHHKAQVTGLCLTHLAVGAPPCSIL